MLTPASDVLFDIPDRVCACSYKIYLFRGGWKIMSWTWSEVFQSHLWLNRHAHSTRIIRVERKFILEIVQIPLINSWPKLPSRDKYPGKLVAVAVSGAGGDLIKVARGMATSCQSLQNAQLLANYCQVSDTWLDNVDSGDSDEKTKHYQDQRTVK